MGPLTIAGLARHGVTQPVAPPVAADDAFFLADKGARQVARRVLQQRLGLLASGQRARQVERLAAPWRRAVWFHGEAPQIGDSLMDLAPRSLFAEHGVVLDVVLPPGPAALFRGDRWLGEVFEHASAVDPRRYDVAIVDRSAWRALAAKRRVAPRLPWLSVHGEYLAYDYHRALLATRRFAQWLGVTLSGADEARHARQKLDVEAATEAPFNAGFAPNATSSVPCIAVAVGGVHAGRRYAAWPDVLAALAHRGPCRFVLLGSANGRADATAIHARLTGHEVLDLVDSTDLYGTRRALAGADLALCADGGLMHLACTTATPLVALFDASIDPAWRLPPAFDGAWLRAATRDVNAIAPATVAERAWALLNRRAA